MNDEALMALLTRKAQAGLKAAADAHKDIWVEELSREGPSRKGEFPAKRTGRAADSIETDVVDLKSVSGSNQSVDYLDPLEEKPFERLGPAAIIDQHEGYIAKQARAAMERQK